VSGDTAIYAQRDRAAPLRLTLNRLMMSQQFIPGGVGGTSPKSPILCQVGRKTLTQSINQSDVRTCYGAGLVRSTWTAT